MTLGKKIYVLDAAIRDEGIASMLFMSHHGSGRYHEFWSLRVVK